MKIKTITIGTDAKVISYSTTQQGYGRQSLYVTLLCEDGTTYDDMYVKDVFPNVLEHYDNYILTDDAFYIEEKNIYADGNGNGEYTEDEVFDSVEELLNHVLDGEEVEVEVPSQYVIVWDRSSNNDYRYANGTQQGTSVESQAIKFDSKAEAEEYMIHNEYGDHCWVSEYNN